VSAQVQIGVDPVLGGLQPQLGQPRQLPPRQHVGGHVGQRLTAPQGKRRVQGRRRLRPPAHPRALAGLFAQRLEPGQVQLAVGDTDQVPITPGGDPRPVQIPQGLPETFDIVPQGHLCRGWRPGVPERLGELVNGHDLVGTEQQCREQHPLARRGNRYLLRLAADEQRPE
jgi:hypothetical protein